MNLYKSLIKPILFKFHPDDVHDFVVNFGEILGKSRLTRFILDKLYGYKNPILEQEVFGIKFENPVGNAGGFDKNAKLIQTLPSCGFGFVEVGSITARAYGGNKKPWNVRLPKDNSLIVNYGLKNDGVEVLKPKIETVKSKNYKHSPIIINIAKTNDMSIKGNESIVDYVYSFQKLQELADIVNINISCPNTGDGVLFCESPELLEKLMIALSKVKISKPIVFKLKPDINDETLYKICDLAEKYDFIKGFIISNLTAHRERLTVTKVEDVAQFKGGISGKPLKELSDQMIAKVYRYTKGKFAIIGVGGIFTAKDAYDKITLGARLVEIATGLIYGGPATVKNINKGLVELIEKDGFTNISEAVGSRNKV